MTRYLFGFLCVCALSVMPLVGCSETTGNGGSGGSAGDGGTGGVEPSPGTLLSAEEIDPFGPNMNVWRVQYTSEAIDKYRESSPLRVSRLRTVFAT